MIKIENLTKYYGNTLGIKDLSLNIKSGECFGFIGPNGAGKSTTIRCIMNVINKTSGKVLIDNKKFNKNDTLINNIIGYLPSEIHLYDDYTVRKMIEYNASFYEKDLSERTNYLCKKLNVDMDKKVDELSLGNLKKVGIVLALMHEPKILILDEATNGLDPLMQEVFYELIREEKAKGTTIFFSTHNLNEIKKICDRVGIVKNGTLIKVGSVKSLTENMFLIVTIYSSELDKMKFDEKIIEKDLDHIKFLYTGSINELTYKLSMINIERLCIEEPSLEDIFIHYYE